MIKDRTCRTHSSCCGGLPGWGLTGMVGAKAKCCGEANPEKAKSFARKMAAKQPHRKAKTIVTDFDAVFAHMKYYKKRTLLTKKQLYSVFPSQEKKYLTFEVDTGGFNNIRMAFEAVVIYAVITGRVLVFPPATGWYLINFGPMQLGSAEGQKSTYDIFFDTTDLCSLIKCMSSKEFALTLPKESRPNANDYVAYSNWLRKHKRLGFPDPMKNLLYW